MVFTSRTDGIVGNEGMKAPVVVATTEPIVLSGLQTIDGVALTLDDRVLVKDQTDGIENGIYVAKNQAWERAGDWDGFRDISSGTLVAAAQGTVNGRIVFQVTTADPIVIGTTAITIETSVTLSTTAFIDTLLDDTSASEARTTLGLGTLATLSTATAATGGTGRTSLTANNVMIGAGTSPVTFVAPGTNRNVLQSNGTTWISGSVPLGRPEIQGFRLSLTTAVPVTTSDVTAAGTIYFIPYKGNTIAIYDGTVWVELTSAEVSLALTATDAKPYDVFAYDNAGTLTLETLVWTNDTTRATGIVYQDGVYCKSGDLTRRYVGSFYTSATNQTEDSEAKRYLFNYDHPVLRNMRVHEATDSWTYTTATWRQARAQTSNQLDYMCGVAENSVVARVAASWQTGSAAGAIKASSGIGVDSTTVPSGLVDNHDNQKSNDPLTNHAFYSGVPGVGRHYLAWLERSTASGTTTWHGDAGLTDIVQSGIEGEVWA